MRSWINTNHIMPFSGWDAFIQWAIDHFRSRRQQQEQTTIAADPVTINQLPNESADIPAHQICDSRTEDSVQQLENGSCGALSRDSPIITVCTKHINVTSKEDATQVEMPENNSNGQEINQVEPGNNEATIPNGATAIRIHYESDV